MQEESETLDHERQYADDLRKLRGHWLEQMQMLAEQDKRQRDNEFSSGENVKSWTYLEFIYLLHLRISKREILDFHLERLIKFIIPIKLLVLLTKQIIIIDQFLHYWLTENKF